MDFLDIPAHDRLAGFAPPRTRGRQPSIFARSGGPTILRALIREPMFHFLVVGALMFGIAEMIEHHRSQYRIVVTPERRTRLAESYRQQYGSSPGDRQFDTLLRNYVREEILYREALALGLDRDDEIVRRRLAQKITFLQQDLAFFEAPTEAEVRAWYDSHRDQYTEPDRRSFTHIYFSPDAGDSEARTRAEQALTQVAHEQNVRDPGLGDAFPGSSDLVDIDADSAERLFGKSELKDAIYAAPIATWSGPYRSGFGWHLIYVTHATAGQALAYEDVRDRATQDFEDSRRTSLNQAAIDTIARRYEVVEEAR